MCIVNTDTESRLGEGMQEKSNINLIFCSDNIVDKINYEQGKDAWGSDHFPIFFEISINNKIYSKVTNRKSTKKTD